MKKFKKLLAVVLSLCMILGMASVVVADEGDESNPISINLEQELGDNYSASVTFSITGGTDGVWYTFTSPIDAVMTFNASKPYDWEENDPDDWFDDDFINYGVDFQLFNTSSEEAVRHTYNENEDIPYNIMLNVSKGDVVLINYNTCNPGGETPSAEYCGFDIVLNGPNTLYNPANVEAGTYTVKAGEEVYYKYIATKAGDLAVTLTPSGDDMDGMWSYKFDLNEDVWPTQGTAEPVVELFQVKEGQEVMLNASVAFWATGGSLTIDIAFDADEAEEPSEEDPVEDTTTEAPAEDVTTAAPAEDVTTAAPAEDVTTGAATEGGATDVGAGVSTSIKIVLVVAMLATGVILVVRKRSKAEA